MKIRCVDVLLKIFYFILFFLQVKHVATVSVSLIYLRNCDVLSMFTNIIFRYYFMNLEPAVQNVCADGRYSTVAVT